MIKRLADMVLAAAGLALFVPAAVIVATVLRCSGEGQIFFAQPRIGRNGRVFPMLKFCTMYSGSAAGFPLAVRNDPRVFGVGRFLRKTKLNEVPQLWNVLLGQMTLVGPRPMLERELVLVPPDVLGKVLSVRPGVTGIGSIVFRDEEAIMSACDRGAERCYAEHIAPFKADLEAWYVDHQSIGLDAQLVLLTVWQILFPHSQAYTRVFGSHRDEILERLARLCGRASEVGAAGSYGHGVDDSAGELRGVKA